MPAIWIFWSVIIHECCNNEDIMQKKTSKILIEWQSKSNNFIWNNPPFHWKKNICPVQVTFRKGCSNNTSSLLHQDAEFSLKQTHWNTVSFTYPMAKYSYLFSLSTEYFRIFDYPLLKILLMTRLKIKLRKTINTQ